MHKTNTLHRGIAAAMNADVEKITNQVNNAQYKVDELTAVVDSLTAKQSQFATLLSQADAKKLTALDHYNQVRMVATDIQELYKYSSTVKVQTAGVQKSISNTTKVMSDLINKLIFSADVIEKLGELVNRQKAINQVIPDELVTILATATTDANNAVALTLTALQSIYASLATADQANSLSQLEKEQAADLTLMLTGTKPDANVTYSDAAQNGPHLVTLLKSAYETSRSNYEAALQASDMATNQLNSAKEDLATATTILNSLKAGLEAAKAAAFAA